MSREITGDSQSMSESWIAAKFLFLFCLLKTHHAVFWPGSKCCVGEKFSFNFQNWNTIIDTDTLFMVWGGRKIVRNMADVNSLVEGRCMMKTSTQLS